jgi:dienelactone hydrolase
MGGMTRYSLAAAFCLLAAPTAAEAQELRFFHPAPAEDSYKVVRDVQYGTSSSGPLRMDVYRPSTGTRHPTVIFFNIATGAERSNPFYASWARIAASRGITAILPDLGMESFRQDFNALQRHIAKLTDESSGIDRNAVAVYAGSGNVWRALPIVQDPGSALVKSAVMFYGGAEVSRFRADLPVLYVRAGLDRPDVNRAMDGIVSAALRENAPVTLLNYPAGYHAFEIRNDDHQTRQVIDQTLDFVKRTTSEKYQASLRRGAREATAAGQVTSGRFGDAAVTYAQLVSESPENATLRLAYGEALLGDRQFAAACAEFENLKGKRLGPRDLGVPAARACMQKGDGAAAIAWLESIPPRFRPRSLENDPIFAPIRDRPEFKALFQTR